MHFACLLKNAVYEVYPPKNKENANIYPRLIKMTLNKETPNETFENKLPFSVLLFMREILILACMQSNLLVFES